MSDEELEGGTIVNLSWLVTGVFGVFAVLTTIWHDSLGTFFSFVAAAMFAAGCAIFLWAYAVAVARSRTDAIGIGGLYFLSGSAPKVIAYRMRLSLAMQIVIASATAAIRPDPLAFGILVPVLGLGLCGLWGARYGQFSPRDQSTDESAAQG